MDTRSCSRPQGPGAVCVCVCAHMLYRCVHVWCACTCVCAVYVCAWVYVRAHVCMGCVCVCACCAYVCVSVCLSVCMCVGGRTRNGIEEEGEPVFFPFSLLQLVAFIMELFFQSKN